MVLPLIVERRARSDRRGQREMREEWLPFTVLGLADDLFARCFEPPSNALAQDLMIVNQENSAHVLSCSFVDSVVTVMSVP